jgi:hypothetical protein
MHAMIRVMVSRLGSPLASAGGPAGLEPAAQVSHMQSLSQSLALLSGSLSD